MLINDNFSSETEFKQTLDFVYERSQEGHCFHGLLEVAFNEVTIITAIHNIKANEGAHTAGLDKKKIDYYLQLPKLELINLVQKSVKDYKPKPVKRIYIEKDNGKKRPLGIPTMLDRIIQECLRLVIEPIVEAKFYPHSYGFRPARACKNAIRDIINVINGCKNNIPIHAIEGDIKGFFDNINHRKLLNKLYNIGIHDKRVIAIIKKMLKAGYFEDGLKNETELGTPQGGILSPLLANVYLNSFDWMIGRMYQYPRQKCKIIGNDRRRLRYNGITPSYLVRYADDWIILTTTEKMAKRLLSYLNKYFRSKLKLELSEEKTIITNLTEKTAKFLSFLIKVGKPRPLPGRKISQTLVCKPYPNNEKVKTQVRKICSKIKSLKSCSSNTERAVIIEEINMSIIGAMEYWKSGICSNTYSYIDDKINNSAFNVFKKIYPKTYMGHNIPIGELNNRPLRHKSEYKSKTWAVKTDNVWIGITKAFLTHSQWEKYPFNQKKTPYTKEGRQLIEKDKKKKQPLDRPALYDTETLGHILTHKGIYNFEYYMNREYAYNRDKGRCRVCGNPLVYGNRHCHHINNSLNISKINKVSNLAWVHEHCHQMIHYSIIHENLPNKVIRKIKDFKQKLAQI